MTNKTTLRALPLFPLLTSLFLAACGDSGTPEATGASTTGGSTSGAGGTGGASGVGGGTGAAVGTGGSTATAGGASGSGGTGATGAGTGGAGTGGAGTGGTGGTGTGAAGATGAGASGGTGGTGGTGATGAGGTGGSGVTVGGPGAAENSGADCNVSAGQTARDDNLPDPFMMHGGTRISTMAEWECRRNEIKRDIEEYEIGPKPEPPMVQASLSGNTLNVVVTTDAGSITLSSTVGNASGAGPHCVVIGMNGNSSLVSGCIQVPFIHDQVVTYGQNSTQYQSDPYYQVYPDLWGQIGNYSAWSWGISRLIDGLDQVKDELDIDMSRIAVHGCSYAGKMALFGGAFDERVALTIAQESGGGGINSWRTSQDFSDRTGTDIEKINNTNYSWFKSSMQRLDPYSLPHDHHELIAMIAPRAVIALGNRDYEWLGDESGYKSINAAREVWKAMGIEDRIGFDFTTGHRHCAAAQSQVDSVNAFVNRFLQGQSTDTNILVDPPANGFDLDYTNVIDWDTPTLQ